jgi:hypothetical protein
MGLERTTTGGVREDTGNRDKEDNGRGLERTTATGG